MKSYFALLAAAGIASVPVVAGYEYLDVVPLEARQATGEKFECHSNCGTLQITLTILCFRSLIFAGNAILGSKDGEVHCSNSTWLGLFEECLECANEFDIWQHYGKGVEEGAEACDLEAVPVGSAATADATTAAGSTTAAAQTTAEATATPSAATEDNGAAQLTGSSVMLFAMLAAAGLM
ncbi:hypothetical protein D7B24_005443 [Verticillium nonalfalfae]|uniref:Uncharacterized protein n=1 Tax=Verticillium nonalfalfae TaxID=1051616 RepID=A0A3M9YBX3_9PEZI|nr:uncharacterized protein D7B24_005443 [Verticillium nonalfalfae]RNJ57959.1 hypothetical protein D7B24_005443 [Verticillium nonalfalfae]